MWKLFRRIKITYGITVCNEAKELRRLLDTLVAYIDRIDEIIVLKDITVPDTAVNEILKKYENHIRMVIAKKLENNFSAFKNNLIQAAKGDYLFQIDADEMPQNSLLKNLKKFLRDNREDSCFAVPRINTVEGYTVEHKSKWNWHIDDKGYINYPDYQGRIFKLNNGIKWINNVHEVLSGCTKINYLPKDEYNMCLLHPKQIDRQERQNDFYEFLSGK